MNNIVNLNGWERSAIFGGLGSSQSREFAAFIVQSEVCAQPTFLASPRFQSPLWFLLARGSRCEISLVS